MPLIPQIVDAGARPSLRTSRVDLPGDQDVIVADALQSAADNFANVAIQRRRQDDADNYNALKSELLKEDLRVRRELQENPTEYEGWMEGYREQMTPIRDRLTAQIRTSGDQNEFQADSDLTIERGATAMYENSRRADMDFRGARLEENLSNLEREIQDPNIDNATRLDLWNTGLRSIVAAEGRGVLGREEAQGRREAFTETIAVSELENMPAAERAEALEASLAANVDPEIFRPKYMATESPKGLIAEGNLNIRDRTPVQLENGQMATVRSMSINEDDVEILIPTVTEDGELLSDEAAIARYHETGAHLGTFDTPENATAYARKLSAQQDKYYSKPPPEGSGSLADFLPRNTRNVMLRRAQAEVAEDDTREQGYAVLDQAFEMFPGDNEAQLKHIRENTEGPVRQFAISEAEQRQAQEARAEDAANQAALEQWTEHVENGGSIAEIPAEIWGPMNPAVKTAIQNFAGQMENRGFADFTDDEAYYEWRDMTPQQKVDANLEGADWKSRLNRDTWDLFVGERQMIKAAIDSAAPLPEYRGDADNEMLTNFILGGQGAEVGLDERPTPGSGEFARWARVDQAYNDRLVRESTRRRAAGQSGDLTADERRQIMADTFQDIAFIPRNRFGPQVFWPTSMEIDPRFVQELSPAQRATAMLPLEAAAQDRIDVGDGEFLNAAEWLQNQSDSFNLDASEKDMMRAYFWLVHGAGDSKALAIEALSGGDMSRYELAEPVPGRGR